MKTFRRSRWRNSRKSFGVFSFTISIVTVLQFATTARAAGTQTLHGHVPAAAARLQPLGHLPGTNRLQLAIGLPLRNQESLTSLLREIYDPASPNFHHYLTPEQFAERFGPTEQDYQAVAAFAKAQGLMVIGRHPNRTLLDVSGPVADIEKALHVSMRLYEHPNQARTFFAPDVEPSINLAVPVLFISGLENSILPRPMNLKIAPLAETANAAPYAGSGPGSSYMGNDFRAAYVPGVSLTGAGQSLGLLEFDGYYANDIAAYESQAVLSTTVTLTNVLIDGFSGSPGTNNVEVALDIEMAISMAPGLSQVIVYESPNRGGSSTTDDMLNRMATDDLAKQISASWSYPIDSLTEQIFQQFAAQGQSFFNASGDSDAWVGAILSPLDDTNITIVGGTTLTMTGSGGSWASETVWNRGNGTGSGGGISTTYLIPSWQQGVNMSANQGSTAMRNIPDVAMVADNIFVIYDNGNAGIFGGTSCSTPLWAAFTALINQQAAISNKPPVGFINPAIYSIGLGAGYASAFHDITTGNNTSSSSPSRFSAATGYDLCTGWGSPAGQNLINAVVALLTPTPPAIITQPQSQTNASGNTVSFSVVAIGSLPLSYQWSFNETNNIIVGATNATLTLTNVQLTNAGNYAVTITNLYGSALSSNAVLTVLTLPPAIITQPSNQTTFVGGTAIFSVTATGSLPLNYQWSFNGTNNIIGATNATLTLTSVQLTNAGNYAVLVTNLYDSILSSNAVLTVNATPPCAPAPSGLVGWWPGEGNANDIAGTNNGVAQNIAYTNGEVGQAFVFDGSSSCVRIPASSNLNVGLGNSFTLETWVNPSSFYYSGSLPVPIFEWNTGSGSDNDPVGVQLYISGAGSGTLSANLEDTSTGFHTIASASSIMVLNVFQHVALTYDKTTGVAVLYRNGMVAATANLGVFTPQTGFDLYLGKRPAGSFAPIYFAGILDEASVYNRALSSNEIANIYNVGTEGKCPPSPTPPVIITQPSNQVVVVGGTASFSVVASGTPSLNYQWSFNGTNNIIIGATNATLTLNSVQFTNAGNYAVLVTNAYGSVLSSNAALTVNAPPPCTPPPSGLVSWWRGESNVLDSFGTNNGTLLGGMSFGPGEVGRGLVFDGASGRVKVPAGSSLNVGLGSGFTFEMWINPANTNNLMSLVEWNNGSGALSGIGVCLQLYPGGRVLTDVRDTSDHTYMSPYGTVRPNRFQHLAWTYDKSSGVSALYLNGMVVNSQNLGSLTAQTSFNFYLGTRPAGTSSPMYFRGTLDEVSLYNRALSSNEIAAIYNAGSSGKCPPPPHIITQPTNQAVAIGGTATFTVVAGGPNPFSYQWNFGGTNNVIIGATNATLTLTNVQPSQAGNYAVLVFNDYGSILSSNALLIVTPHHFAWNPVPSPRFVNIPFSVIIQAQNATNGLFTNFTASANLSSTNGVAIIPSVSGNFIQGVWTGSVTVPQTVSNLVLRADDGYGHFGLANPINVVNLPGLGAMPFGNVLLLQWPAVSSAFVLEASGSLSPAAWVQVPYIPTQIGGQYVVPLDMNGTNCFYRLRFTGP